MKKPDWSFRILIRYSWLQVPAFVLWILLLILVQRWLDLPKWSIWALGILWVIKEIILFPYVWRAYDTRSDNPHPLINEVGRVETSLSPSGYIRIRGELWRAELVGGNPSLFKGERVRVQSVDGLTLFVHPVPNEESSNAEANRMSIPL